MPEAPATATQAPLTAEQRILRAAQTAQGISLPEHRVSPPPSQPATSEAPAAPQPAEPPARPAEQPARQVEKPKQYHYIESGRTDLEIKVDSRSASEIARRLLKRRQVAEDLRENEQNLTTVDRLTLRLTPEALSSIERGEFSKETLAVAYYMLHDELLQKAVSTAQLVRDRRGRFDRAIQNVPIIGRLARGPQTQLEAIQQGMSTEYTRRIGFNEWDERRIEQDLRELNQLRLTTEYRLFERGFRNPLFDRVSTAIHPTEFTRKTGNRLHDMVVDELVGTEGVLTHRFGGRSFGDLWQNEPETALQALFEANQRALTRFTGESAKTLLAEEKPRVNLSDIEAQAQRLEKPADEQELQRLQNEATTASTQFTEAQQALTRLQEQHRTGREKLPELASTHRQAQASFERRQERLNNEILELENQLGDSQHQRANPPAGINQRERAEFLQSLDQQITRYTELLTQRRTALDQLIDRVASAEEALLAQRENVNDLQQQANEAQNTFREQETAKNDADRRLQEARSGSPERKEQARALRKWAEVVGKVEKIIDTRFSQQHGGEFARDRLASTQTRADGSIDGLERIREHILQVINPSDYDAALARRMLSDETILRAIVYHFNLDAEGTVLRAGVRSVREAGVARIEPADVTLTDAIRSQDEATRAMAINHLLPLLRNSQFNVGDLIRFLAQEGATSASLRGEPYLRLSDYYLGTQPELRPEAPPLPQPPEGPRPPYTPPIQWGQPPEPPWPYRARVSGPPFSETARAAWQTAQRTAERARQAIARRRRQRTQATDEEEGGGGTPSAPATA